MVFSGNFPVAALHDGRDALVTHAVVVINGV